MRTIEAPETDTILQGVRGVADELRLVAAEVDDQRVSADRAYATIRRAGLLRVLVPQAVGGQGVSFLEYTKILETLATGDGSAALGFNMHNVAIGSLCESWGTDLHAAGERFRSWVFSEVVDNSRMFASATSETGAGAKLRGIKTTYRRSGDGFVLNGNKSFVSLAKVADFYVATAKEDGATEVDEVSHFVVARNDQGVTFDGLWDGAALNGTATARMTMSDVHVGRDRLFLGVEGMSLFKLVREPHWMVSGYMGAYLGIAQSIMDYATGFLAADDGRRSSPVTQAEIGRMSVELSAARALVYSAAELVDRRKGSVETNTAVHAAKYYIGELAPRLALIAVRICGSASLRKTSPLERLLREAAFCSVMPAKPDECLEYVGKAALGFNMFDTNTVQW